MRVALQLLSAHMHFPAAFQVPSQKPSCSASVVAAVPCCTVWVSQDVPTFLLPARTSFPGVYAVHATPHTDGPQETVFNFGKEQQTAHPKRVNIRSDRQWCQHLCPHAGRDSHAVTSASLGLPWNLTAISIRVLQQTLLAASPVFARLHGIPTIFSKNSSGATILASPGRPAASGSHVTQLRLTGDICPSLALGPMHRDAAATLQTRGQRPRGPEEKRNRGWALRACLQRRARPMGPPALGWPSHSP